MKEKMSGVKMWTLIWGLGLAAQICWNIENSWFNTFVYAKIGKYPEIITGMLICSAAATTFSTFFFGTWSDRIGKRKIFISAGYVLWGIFTIAFGLTEFISRDLFLFTAVSVVLADTVMSFFGSMANDAGYNAWCNDIMTDDNRGQIGASLATQPVIGTILGTVVGGMLIGSDDNYMRLFLVIGGAIILFGILSFFAMGENGSIEPSVRGSFWEQFLSVFDFRSLVKNRELFLVHVALAIFFVGFNTYFAYIGNYLIYYLGFTADQIGIIEAIPLVLAMLFSIPVSGLLNKNHHVSVAFGAVLTNFAGLMILYPVKAAQVDASAIFAPSNIRLFLGIFVLGVGYIAFLQTMKVWAKQLYPADSRGQFEGIWILFFVLIPMVGGSLLGQTVVKTSGETFVNAESLQTEYIPNGNIFLVGGLFVLLSLLPVWGCRKHFRDRLKV
ncbi:MAG: MFS transporter [Lachnospiraceae bacterium]|nr:MFS transporter [Lachnospiraceae bacterium]